MWKKLILINIFCCVFYINAISKPIFVVTIKPIKSILQEIVADKADMELLVPPASSPHTYLPRPSQVIKSQASTALFYISEHLDGWAAKQPAKNKIELINFLPNNYRLTFEDEHVHRHNKDEYEYDKQVIDPHFWLDPITVKSILPALVKTLSKLDKKNANIYKSNAKKFVIRLDRLNEKINKLLNDIKGESIFLFHPSFRYFLKRYDLIYGGAVETSPGKEPSPKFIAKLIRDITASGTKALFTEPQLPENSVRIIAESVNLRVFTLDPIGVSKAITNYSELILYNAKIFKKAIK